MGERMREKYNILSLNKVSGCYTSENWLFCFSVDPWLIQWARGKHICSYKPLRLWSYLLLQHNLAYHASYNGIFHKHKGSRIQKTKPPVGIQYGELICIIWYLQAEDLWAFRVSLWLVIGLLCSDLRVYLYFSEMPFPPYKWCIC